MLTRTWILFCLVLSGSIAAATEPASLKIGWPGEAISTDLFGVFFEDINYSADGGLYAELIQNRSFDYHPVEQAAWNALSYWEVTRRGDGAGRVEIDLAAPLHENNPHYLVLDVSRVGDGVGLVNEGFDGIPVTGGARYRVSFFARPLYLDRRWGGEIIEEGSPPHRFEARLESKEGELLGSVELEATGPGWSRVEGLVEATATDPDARFVLLCKTQGGVALDVVSLFPEETFRGRKNGLRPDLAQTIADMKPRFVRFPGGCLVHGNGLPNMYRWQDSVGPIETRRAQPNIWRYHQTLGLGYFEYFQFCEDIGAKPVPIVPAAVSCQNSAYTAGEGQEGIPLEEMPAYIEEVIDLVEWANGPPTSEWGAVRAAAGHPEPFGLEYLGVGNEDRITPGFAERFEMIYHALRERCPEITVIGTVGPAPDGEDWEKGWEVANRLDVPIVDEHYYRSPKWFLENTQRYDAFDRARSKVYVGEYAAHDRGRRSTLRSALAEAAYMTHLERNADLAVMSSYAPLLAKNGRTQWRPDLVYFDNTSVYPTVNYHVQKLFGQHAGDRLLSTIGGDGLHSSAVYDSASRNVIVKLVNASDTAQSTGLDLRDLPSVTAEAQVWTLTGDPNATNPSHAGEAAREAMEPSESTLPFGSATVELDLPANSLTVVRFAVGE